MTWPILHHSNLTQAGRSHAQVRRTPKYAVAFLVVMTAACGGAQAPTGPAPRPPSQAPSNLPAPLGPSVAVLAVEVFTVTSRRCGTWFCYVPALRVAETSGNSAAWITTLLFDLNAGPDGRVPTWNVSTVVPAGGVSDLIGETEFEISSDKVNATQVSVRIDFLDDQGRRGSVNAVAVVSQ